MLLDGPFLAGVSQFHRLNILAARRIFGGPMPPAGWHVSLYCDSQIQFYLY